MLLVVADAGLDLVRRKLLLGERLSDTRDSPDNRDKAATATERVMK
jgi:hypothetical protein